MTLGPGFTCDYDSQITVSASTNVTIHGNGAVLDAAKQGRFFTVPSGAALALDHVVLQNGFVDNGDVSAWLRGLAYGITRPPSTDHHALTTMHVCIIAPHSPHKKMLEIPGQELEQF